MRVPRLLGFWALVVFVLAVRAFAGGLLPARQPMVVEPFVVDINRAGVSELRLLPGIGVTRAEAIVLERIRNGLFRSIDDLQRVDGIGPDSCGRLRAFATCSDR